MLPLLHSPRAFESVLCFTAHMTATYTSLRLTLEPQGFMSLACTCWMHYKCCHWSRFNNPIA